MSRIITVYADDAYSAMEYAVTQANGSNDENLWRDDGVKCEWSTSVEEEKEKPVKPVKKVKISPMLKQFYELKKKHPDALLLFRCGDFYETYCDDALKASDTLGITLTKSRQSTEKDGTDLRMAGFPYHALDTYLPKLIRAGHRIAICDQIEEPNKKKK